MYELETLVVPKELGKWLQSMAIRESGAYFSTIGAMYRYWETVVGSPIGDFIVQNKKELIEVIIGSRGYRIEKPLYRAFIKGHELIDGAKSYWYFNKAVDGVFISNACHTLLWEITEMTKAEWNKLGINDSNADFIET